MMQQNDMERIQDRLQRGVLTMAQANVEMVLSARVRIVRSRIPRDVRKALMGAVKDGKLGRMKKNGLKPEVFYHPTFDYVARKARNDFADNAQAALCQVSVHHIPDVRKKV